MVLQVRAITPKKLQNKGKKLSEGSGNLKTQDNYGRELKLG